MSNFDRFQHCSSISALYIYVEGANSKQTLSELTNNAQNSIYIYQLATELKINFVKSSKTPKLE